MTAAAQLNREAAELANKRCGACAFYGDPERWSAACTHPGGPPSWTYDGDRIVRRDNGCPRFAAVRADRRAA